MKIKSLLVAGMAVLALNAVAEDYSCQSKIAFDMDLIRNATIGEKIAYFPVTMTRADEAADFTNIQCYMALPTQMEGNNCRANNGTISYNEDEDDNIQPLSWTCGMVEGTNDFLIVGVNLTKTPIKAQEFQLCDIRMTVKEELPKDAKIRFYDFKYTDYADNTWIAENWEVPIFEDTAVSDINAGKAVAGVKYYNVAGVAADKAFDGVNIVVTTYADGTQNVVKVVK